MVLPVAGAIGVKIGAAAVKAAAPIIKRGIQSSFNHINNALNAKESIHQASKLLDFDNRESNGKDLSVGVNELSPAMNPVISGASSVPVKKRIKHELKIEAAEDLEERKDFSAEQHQQRSQLTARISDPKLTPENTRNPDEDTQEKQQDNSPSSIRKPWQTPMCTPR